jgi:hypothetical protein
LREHIKTSDRHYADYFLSTARKSAGKKFGGEAADKRASAGMVV